MIKFLTRLFLVITFIFSIACTLYTSAFAQNGDKFTYVLGPGDKLRITVFGEEDLSGEFEINPSGELSLALIGTIKATKIDTQKLERKIEKEYSEGYLINPRVSIEVLNFRPFFILGEVNNPGSYPYVNGLTVLNAVALAGGYTHRARTNSVMVKRDKKNDGKEFDLKEGDLVQPGDIIRVKERFF